MYLAAAALGDLPYPAEHAGRRTYIHTSIQTTYGDEACLSLSLAPTCILHTFIHTCTYIHTLPHSKLSIDERIWKPKKLIRLTLPSYHPIIRLGGGIRVNSNQSPSIMIKLWMYAGWGTCTYSTRVTAPSAINGWTEPAGEIRGGGWLFKGNKDPTTDSLMGFGSVVCCLVFWEGLKEKKEILRRGASTREKNMLSVS